MIYLTAKKEVLKNTAKTKKTIRLNDVNNSTGNSERLCDATEKNFFIKLYSIFNKLNTTVGRSISNKV
jgi:tRNA pseudouridine-54 N-methylase